MGQAKESYRQLLSEDVSALAFLMAKKMDVPILSLGLPMLARSFHCAWDDSAAPRFQH
jgi:hypothetical protein